MSNYTTLRESLQNLSPCIDSRTLQLPKYSFFIALKGNQTDGHDWIEEVYEKGCRAFIIHKNTQTSIPEKYLYRVENTLTAFQELAAEKRRRFPIPILGITGSNGKTIIKEWLSQILSLRYQVCKSPKSFNSKIGVPLSLWGLQAHHTLGVFEAGISEVGEMDRLAYLIKPDIGILTNIGTAHDSGFSSRTEKIKEKLLLFKDCKEVFLPEDPDILKIAREQLPPTVTLRCRGKSENAEFIYSTYQSKAGATFMKVKHKMNEYSFLLSNFHTYFIENMACVIHLALELGIDRELLEIHIPNIQSLSMRLEWIEGTKGSKILDDTYTHDLSAFKAALETFTGFSKKGYRWLILSDFQDADVHSDRNPYPEWQRICKEADISQMLLVGKQISKYAAQTNIPFKLFETSEDLEKYIKNNLSLFEDQWLLIKGSRSYGFEKIVQTLRIQHHRTHLEINLEAIAHNLSMYRERLPSTMKIMVMVKAFAYGAGSEEIARLLEYHRVDYLGVAYVDEGIHLRKKGIIIPIMVMNVSEDEIDICSEYRLEPEIYSRAFLEKIIQWARLKERHLKNTPLSVHIKVDTGMKRLGFDQKEWSEVLIHLSKTQELIHIQSMYTHLAAADDALHDTFTMQQLSLFQSMSSQLQEKTNNKVLKHALNTAGIERFPKEKMDMVRLGIGLYGISSSGEFQEKLRTVSALKTFVTQIKTVEEGESIGYGRKGCIKGGGKIATIAIGYADGFSRAFSNGKGFVKIRNQWKPIVGNVCMDMCMVDITGIDGIQEGEEVTIFDQAEDIVRMANACDTIPYEILTSISQRVRRTFIHD